MKYNLNFCWKFAKPSTPFPLSDASESLKIDNKDFFALSYDDSSWEEVAIPHAPNASESFDSLIRDAGEATLYRGFMFYRKNFVLDDICNKKFFLEFEAVRQSIYLYVNAGFVGYYEAGTAPVGFDITPFVKKGENIISLATDNAAYRECEFSTIETIPGHTPGDLSGVRHQWNQKDFNEVQGGITGNVNLYVKPLLYQTLPLYNNLKTTGNYIYASSFDFENKTATVNIKAEIRNETGADKNARLTVNIKDGENTVFSFASPLCLIKAANDQNIHFKTVVPSDAYSESPRPTNAVTADVSYIHASFKAPQLIFWSLSEPHLYNVETVLEFDNECDTQSVLTGFRSVTYDISRGGLLINNLPVYLKGYAQRSTDEWAVIGVANDHLYDFDARLIRDSGANYIRWMHVTPKPSAIRSGDKYGIVSVCPAGDKESDCSGRQWAMRVEAMRDAIICFRNSPSVIFYEAGNAAISPEHMAEMTKIKNALDPYGFRFMGSRSLTEPEQIKNAEWVGTMVYRYDAHAKQTMDLINRHIPMLETEYKRDESPRRVWDDFSPPHYDYINKYLGDGAKKTDGYDVWDETQEDFCVLAASDKDGYAYFYNNRVDGSTKNNYYSGAAIMVWSDSNMHGRNCGSENCRTTGKVDAVRIKKPAFFALRAMHSLKPCVHILGHWNYPPDTSENYNYFEKEWNGTYFEQTDKMSRRNPKDKTIYVIASISCKRVELYIQGELVAECSSPKDNYIYAFSHIDITKHGEIKAVAYDKFNNPAATHTIKTAGEPAKIVLTPHTGPKGLIADGSDIAFFDVSICDKDGNICPTAYNKINFSLTGDGVFLGGYNSGTYDKTSVIHKNHCFAECGTNRVFVRSRLFGKSFTLCAESDGLESCSCSMDLTELSLKNGMSDTPQASYLPNTFTTEEEILPTDEFYLSSSHEKDIYTVLVNNTPVLFKTPPYRPDSASGVLCAVRPVLDLLNVDYVFSQNDKASLKIISSGATITQGETTISINGETNLTNAEVYVENGELIAEISALLAYIENVTVKTDAQTKTLTIEKSAV